MDFTANTDVVLQILVDLWAERQTDLSFYVRKTFEFAYPSQHEVTRLIIAEMADGDVQGGNIGSLFSGKWVLQEGELRSVPLDFAYDVMYDTDDSGEVFFTPSFLFCLSGNMVLLSERYGPSLVHRLRGHIRSANHKTIVDLETLWRSNDI